MNAFPGTTLCSRLWKEDKTWHWVITCEHQHLGFPLQAGLASHTPESVPSSNHRDTSGSCSGLENISSRTGNTSHLILLSSGIVQGAVQEIRGKPVSFQRPTGTLWHLFSPWCATFLTIGWLLGRNRICSWARVAFPRCSIYCRLSGSIFWKWSKTQIYQSQSFYKGFITTPCVVGPVICLAQINPSLL